MTRSDSLPGLWLFSGKSRSRARVQDNGRVVGQGSIHRVDISQPIGLQRRYKAGINSLLGSHARFSGKALVDPAWHPFFQNSHFLVPKYPKHPPRAGRRK